MLSVTALGIASDSILCTCFVFVSVTMKGKAV